ncbi:hypothetical protein [Burkholderia sp. L27(2015)]|uniref:hypothetical protein n=1 Tax=Burkholderia sp. L27(2015) TaxID=1641858 RepID=UPI00131E6F70|nr:hypothetical protein [Burkholderia sp. L27(2015)]
MKLRVISTAVVLISAAIYAAPSMAFGLPSIPGIGGSGGSSTSVDVGSLTKQQSDLLVTMSASLLNLSNAQSIMADALDLKEQAAIAKSNADKLSAGNLTGKDDTAKFVESSLSVNKAIADKMAKGEALSSDSKAKFATSLLPYGQGSVGMVAAAQKAAGAAQSLTHTTDPTVLFKLGSLLYVAQEAPALISSFGGATSHIISFASAQGIDTSALKTAAAKLGD